MNRRGFLAALGGMIVVPAFGRFYRQGSGQLWRPKDAFIAHANLYADLAVSRPNLSGLTYGQWRTDALAMTQDAFEKVAADLRKPSGLWWDDTTGPIWNTTFPGA